MKESLDRVVSVAIIDGSPRAESSSRVLALSIAEQIGSRGGEVSFFDQTIHRLPLFDDDAVTTEHRAVQELFACVRAADCIVLSSPEYHNSMSGALKNSLDWLSRMPEREGRAPLLCGLIGGGGAMGNSGALLQMMMAVRSMKWWLMPDVIVSVPDIWDAFQDGKLVNMTMEKRAIQFCDALLHYGQEFKRFRRAA